MCSAQSLSCRCSRFCLQMRPKKGLYLMKTHELFGFTSSYSKFHDFRTFHCANNYVFPMSICNYYLVKFCFLIQGEVFLFNFIAKNSFHIYSCLPLFLLPFPLSPHWSCLPFYYVIKRLGYILSDMGLDNLRKEKVHSYLNSIVAKINRWI